MIQHNKQVSLRMTKEEADTLMNFLSENEFVSISGLCKKLLMKYIAAHNLRMGLASNDVEIPEVEDFDPQDD